MGKLSDRLDNRKARTFQPMGIPRTDLVDHVSGLLREAIVEGEFEAGDQLPGEMELAEGYGVSRRVIREALRILKSQGLVEIRQGKLPVVRPANDEAIQSSLQMSLLRHGCTLEDIYEARRPLEIEIVRLAAERASDEDIADIEEHYGAYDRYTRHGTILHFEKRIQSDIDFHLAIARAAHNSVLELLYRNLFTIFWDRCMEDHDFMSRMIDRNIKTRRYLPIQFHERILQAIRDREPEAALEASVAHLDQSLFMIHLQDKDQ